MEVFSPEDKKELTLLCVSDTHEHYQGIARAMALAAQMKVDYVIHSGDWTNLKKEEQSDPLKIAEAEASIASQLSQLESLVKPVLYIPGNHDPKTLFKHLHPEPVSLSPYSKLLSDTPMELAPGLAILGFGGAPPGYAGTEEVFAGYPYDDQESYDQMFTTAMNFPPSPDTQYILVSHCGPANLPTSTIITQTRSTRSASESLYQLLLDPV
jgi:Icc-related predicted phosphoesterase